MRSTYAVIVSGLLFVSCAVPQAVSQTGAAQAPTARTDAAAVAPDLPRTKEIAQVLPPEQPEAPVEEEQAFQVFVPKIGKDWEIDAEQQSKAGPGEFYFHNVRTHVPVMLVVAGFEGTPKENAEHAADMRNKNGDDKADKVVVSGDGDVASFRYASARDGKPFKGKTVFRRLLKKEPGLMVMAMGQWPAALEKPMLRDFDLLTLGVKVVPAKPPVRK